MLNYYNRTVEPILSAITDEMKRKYLTKTARTQLQSIMFFRDPFKLVPLSMLAEIFDKLTRNEIISSNEARSVIGYKPSDEPRADKLENKNMNVNPELPPAQIDSSNKDGNMEGDKKIMAKFDFSGYATKNNLKCSDGRTIRKDAFIENDGETVPLVWQHGHDGPNNVLGHALLENREDGVYTFGAFNDSDAGRNAKLLVEHGDITALSIYANGLLQKGGSVIHGAIKEVSLVLAGANPGALIDNLAINHGDGTYDTDETEAVIFTGEALSLTSLEHAEKAQESGGDKTVQDVFDTLNEEQKNVVYAMLAHALDSEEETDDTNINHSDEGGTDMKTNVFDNKDQGDEMNVLSHDQLQEILVDAQKCGSLKESFLAHVATYGIENIDMLFPDAKTVTSTPEVISRRMEWVQSVISGTKHSPFSRIKSTAVDITADVARARGYVKGNLKKEEIIKLLKRVTTPTTVYKKQKLDHDDVVDITDLDVVSWLKAEMRIMLDEELARAVLIGDGRDIESEDKINEECLRPIAFDDAMYAHPVTVPANVTGDYLIEAILRARPVFKGNGTPTFYTTETILTDLLLLKR